MNRYYSLYFRQKQLPDLRKVVHIDAETNKQYTFLTNQCKLSAQTVADIYKLHWQIELFFKGIKQNFKIKSSSVSARMQ
jgi:IS4 transposase